MKNNYLLLCVLSLLFYSCTQKPASVGETGNSEHGTNPKSIQQRIFTNGVNPKSFRQITFTIDTLVANYVVKELKNVSDVTLNEEGEIASATQTNYSFENQEGIVENTKEIYSPESHWLFGDQSEYEPIFNKYYHQPFSDTLIAENEYTFQYNNNNQLILIKGSWGFQMDFNYDQHGQWIEITKHFSDERSGHVTYEITKRKIHYDENPLNSLNPTYLSINGENIFEKKKKSIVDYYILANKAAIFSPDRGEFDIPNGYFEYEDEGTGAGVYTGQLVMFKTNDEKDIIAINGFYGEAISYYTISGDRPKFYIFENNSFTEAVDLFPELNSKIFFEKGFTGEVEGINTFFTLPQKGLSIKYLVDPNLEQFCDEMNTNHDLYDMYKGICENYSNLKRTSIDITFDKNSGTFIIQDHMF
ncbi:MAG: hypothetical protein OEW67_09965 [Cyclobacteriaceae bacterium]|nr:hypothetical protein [Cyclobacteriaceae bacterium]